jgi:hypothetical protein
MAVNERQRVDRPEAFVETPMARDPEAIVLGPFKLREA